MRECTKYLSLSETAKRLKIGMNMTYRHLWAGRFPGARKRAGKWEIPESDIVAYVERKRREFEDRFRGVA